MFAYAKNMGLKVGDFGEFVDRLNEEGSLLAKGGKRYELSGHFL
jgi:hypothetical protein